MLDYDWGGAGGGSSRLEHHDPLAGTLLVAVAGAGGGGTNRIQTPRLQFGQGGGGNRNAPADPVKAFAGASRTQYGQAGTCGEGGGGGGYRGGGVTGSRGGGAGGTSYTHWRVWDTRIEDGVDGGVGGGQTPVIASISPGGTGGTGNNNGQHGRVVLVPTFMFRTAPLPETCVCPIGYYLNSTDSCLPCPEDTYCDEEDLPAPKACPAHSHAPNMSVSITACECETRYYALGSHVCELCTPAFYCPGGNTERRIACPLQGQTSEEGAAMVEDCFCGNGYYHGETSCVLCPADHFCPTQRAPPLTAPIPCHEGSETLAPVRGNTARSACRCSPGWVFNTSTECLPCPEDTWCAGDVAALQHCPEHTSTHGLVRQALESACLAVAGYFHVLEGRVGATICPVGQWCGGRGADPRDCPSFSTNNETGAESPRDCKCDVGYYGTCVLTAESCQTNGFCLLCPFGRWCPGGDEFRSCGLGAQTTVTGATSSGACLCDAGFYIKAGEADCSLCEPGFLCPGEALGGGRTPCPGNAKTKGGESGGKSMASDCVCNAGFVKSSDGARCEMCGSNTYCPDDDLETVFDCPANATAPAESSAPSACVCKPGTYNEYDDASQLYCKQCDVGFYCASNGEKTACGALRTTAGAGTVSASECVCVPGRYGTACDECPVGTFCPDGRVARDCPDAIRMTTVGVGSVSQAACSCNDGFYKADNGSMCIPCPTGVICTLGEQTRCPDPAMVVALDGGQEQLVCVCPAGRFADTVTRLADNTTEVVCTQCEGAFFCPGGLAQARISCPSAHNMTTVSPGATSVDECRCADGMYLVATTGQCALCEPGWWCADNARFPCSDTNKVTVGQGATNETTDCVCRAGLYQPVAYGACEPCPEGQFCVLGSVGNGQGCPQGTTAPQGSANETNCIGIPSVFGLTEIFITPPAGLVVARGSPAEADLFAAIREAVAASTFTAASNVCVYWRSDGSCPDRRIRRRRRRLFQQQQNLVDDDVLVAETDVPIASPQVLEVVQSNVAVTLADDGFEGFEVAAAYTSATGVSFATVNATLTEEATDDDANDDDAGGDIDVVLVVVGSILGLAGVMVIVVVVWCVLRGGGRDDAGSGGDDGPRKQQRQESSSKKQKSKGGGKNNNPSDDTGTNALDKVVLEKSSDPVVLSDVVVQQGGKDGGATTSGQFWQRTAFSLDNGPTRQQQARGKYRPVQTTGW